MNHAFSLSIFFPAYNEESTITESVIQAENIAKTLTKTYEIIIVNDGSDDETASVANALAKKNPRVRVVHHETNQGYGAAVWSGIQAAKNDYIFFTDADLQFNLKELAKLVKHIPTYSVVIGYRAKRRDPFMRLANAWGWNILNRLMFGLKVKDVDCAFKVLKRDIVQDLPIKARGAMISAELLIRLQRQGIAFKEVPVSHLPRKTGSPTGAKPSVIVRAFKELFQTYRGELGNVTHRQVIKFAMVGVLNTFVDLATYVVLTRFSPYFQDHIISAKVLTFALASIVSFLVNRTWTFGRTNRATFNEVAKFYITALAALAINAVSLYLLVPFFHSDLPAVITATIITFGWNFTVSKFWVFTKQQHGAQNKKKESPS